ncbi:hypothetical protein [Bacillus sp. ISL-57]|uniref:hypothetical protein n=1 Tax=Bacillus sp. ISL-57 TaxID=2819135 RepID=UPI001BEA1A59|nr:hypothetical protein [Bacillus sp. ISL-57]MBT2718064.1 hypothetical protein [Bacillus sp. ISL-57]
MELKELITFNESELKTLQSILYEAVSSGGTYFEDAEQIYNKINNKLNRIGELKQW